MSSKKRLLAQYVVHSNWFEKALKDFSDEETNSRVNPDMNHVKYLAGHLFHAQYSFAFIAGLKMETKWDELFAGRGKSKAKDHFPYPTITEIKTEFGQLYPLVKKALEAMTEEDLEKRMPESPVAKTGIFDDTLGDLWAFLNLHQAYHIGQIGILRRGFGKEPMRFF